MAKTKRIGQLKKRIELQEPVTSDDSFGESTVSNYVTYDTVWAAIEPLNARERFYAQQMKQETTHNVMIRYRKNVNSSHRIEYDNRFFEIESVINIGEADRYLQLVCKELEPDS